MSYNLSAHFSLSTDETEVPLSPAWEDIEAVIERMNDLNDQSFLVLQAIWCSEKTRGFFKKTREPAFYQVEVQICQPDGTRIQYALKTQNKEDVKKIFQDFFVQQRLPGLKDWENAGFY